MKLISYALEGSRALTRTRGGVMLHALNAVGSCSALSLRSSVRDAIVLTLLDLYGMLQIFYAVIDISIFISIHLTNTLRIRCSL